MEINHKEQDGIICITINGRLDADGAPEAESVTKSILDADHKWLLFDCSGLEYLSSVGLRVILGVAKAVDRKGGKIILCCLTQFVKEIFEISRFDALIPIADSCESGLQQLKEAQG
jgi:anti-anti-sigma factor